MALFLFWPLSRESSLDELSPFDSHAKISPSPPCLPFFCMWMATCPLPYSGPRPAALHATCLICTGLLYLSLVLLLAFCTQHLEPHAYYFYIAPFRPSCADFPLVSYLSPSLASCFPGSSLKASFVSVWRYLFHRHGFLVVHFSSQVTGVPCAA